MGRPAKNPEHPLTRLRKALSTPTREMTRALFSKKVGIPEATIKAIETGKFKISAKNAAQIASATKVDPKCLLDPSLPLTDYLGVPFEDQPILANYSGDFRDIEALFDTAFEVAEEKQKQAVFSFLFQRWLEETSEILGLRPGITRKLEERYPIQCFEAIPDCFWPKDQKKRQDIDKGVMKFDEEFFAELKKLLTARDKTEPKDQKKRKDIDKGVMKFDEELFAKFKFDEEFLAELEKLLTHPNETEPKDQKKRKDIDRRVMTPPDETDRDFMNFLRECFGFGGVAWDLRKKMIEEAKASLQREPTGRQTR
jgi:DNA-binding XRE family transcriptional regulator